MKLKKIIATSLIAGILGMNYVPMCAVAVEELNETQIIKEKKLSKKEKKALAEKQNRINYLNIDWWEGYNDTILMGYIFKALENNQDLKIATLKVEEARQSTKLQLSKELPQFSIGASPALIKMPNVTNTMGVFSVPMIASYEADIFLKNRDKTKSVKKLYEASQQQERATYISIVSEVAATYYNIVKLDELISLQEELINDRKEIYDLMKLANEEGIASTSDLVKADKAYIVAVSDLYDLKKAREIILNTLCVLIGESPANAQDLQRISYNEINVEKIIPEKISSEVITSRPDYLVAQKMLEKSGIDVRVAKKEFLPAIDILGLLSFSVTSAAGSGGMSWRNAIAGGAGSVMLPLFTGGAKMANFKINKNRYEQALQNYQKTNLTAIKEVNDALSRLKLDNEKYQKNLQAYDMEAQDFGFSQMKYDEGVISNLDLLQRKETLLVMKKMVATTKTETLINHIGLYKAVAGNL